MRLGKRARLAAAIDAAIRDVHGPMVWGVDDCGLWFANVIKAALGYDPAYQYRDRYKTAFGAKRALAIAGGLAGALERVAQVRGWRKIKRGQARVGDVGLTMSATGPTVMLRHRKLWVGRSDGGFGAVPTKNILVAWRVR